MSDCCSVKDSLAAPAVAACPANGARSKRVDILTVKSLVRQLPLGMPNTQYYFCEAQDCDVVYFAVDSQAPTFRRGDLLVSVGAKATVDPIPVCYCFGFTRKDIQDEITATGCDDRRADFSGSKSRQLRLRSEKSVREMLLGQCHARNSRLSAESAGGRDQGRKLAATR